MKLLNLIELSDEEFAGVARQAFLIGLKDGRIKSGPCTAIELMNRLQIPYNINQWRIVDKQKLRQVYGAGFDIRRLERWQKEKR